MTDSRKVRINQGRIVPWQFRLAGTVLVFMLILAAFIKFPEVFAIPTTIGLSFLLPLLWSSYYMLEIDPERKTVSEIVWIMGHKKGEQTFYESIEKIFINPVKVGQRISSYTGHVNAFRSREFIACLKLGGGKEFELISHKDLAELRKKVDPISKKLECSVVGNL